MASGLAALARRRLAVPSLALRMGRGFMSALPINGQYRPSAVRDLALPTTIETYLALRSSTYELQELPETSFIKLIYDSGSAGLSGLVQNIVSDVLSHRVAQPDSDRQRRLLTTLLYMLSYNARKLHMEPEMVIQISKALINGRHGSLDNLSPFVAMYILRMALSLQTFNGPQLDLIRPVFRRLVHTGDYPNVGEGLHVIEHLLEHSDLEPESVMDFVSRTVQSDGQRIGEQTLQQARADGMEWRIWAKSQSEESKTSTRDPFQAHALRITIWSLCCRTWLRLNRTKRFRNALLRLNKALQDADNWATRRQPALKASPRTAIVRTLLQMHLVHLASSSSHNAIAAASETIAAFSSEINQVLPRVLSMVCAKAVELDMVNCAVSILRTVQMRFELDSATPSYSKAFVLQLGPTVLLRALQHYVQANQFADVAALYTWVWETLPGEAWDLFWPLPLRAELLACIAASEMQAESKSLFVRWTEGLRIVPSEERRAWTSTPRAHFDPMGIGHVSLIRRLLRVVRRGGPSSLFRDVAGRATKRPAEAPQPALLATAPCLLALVKLFGRTPRFGNPHDLSFAVMVRDHFLMAMPVQDRSRHELTALAQASLIIGDRNTAADLFRTLYQRGLDASAFAVLLRGAFDVHPDEAVTAFLALPDSSAKHDLVNNPRLYAVLISRCVSLSRFDLADRVYAAGEARGLGGRITAEARPSLLANTSLSPRAVMRQMIGMMDEGWKPEMRLVNWAIRSMVRGYSLREAGSSPGTVVNRALGSAIKLFLRASSHLHTVDLAVTRFLLYHIGCAARSMNPYMKRTQPQWVVYVDQIASALRWTRHIVGASTYARLENIPVPTTKNISTEPNNLPRSLLRQFVVAYDALGDQRGVVETLAWMDAAGVLNENSPDTLAEKAFQRILRRARKRAGVVETPRTKRWWSSELRAVHS